MPELPDLEVYAGNLTKQLSQKEVADVFVFAEDKCNASQEKLQQSLISARVDSFRRSGKEMHINFSNGQKIGIHLMLMGRFDIVSDLEPVPFKLLAIRFAKQYLTVSDPKIWAKITLNPVESKVPDALSADFTPSYLVTKLMEKKTKQIKAFLIDQSIVRGIGNAYVDEILWEAKISPESKAGKLPSDVVNCLHHSICHVLQRSVKEILAINPDIINGEIREFMRVHNKNRQHCPNGFPIKVSKITSKTTYYTDEQRIF
ncbi:MAG: hypothetical protein MJB14_21115 [Spirochaetes bacterium]|nr:hypothetical protein [Spirochaetota bacterium]